MFYLESIKYQYIMIILFIISFIIASILGFLFKINNPKTKNFIFNKRFETVIPILMIPIFIYSMYDMQQTYFNPKNIKINPLESNVYDIKVLADKNLILSVDNNPLKTLDKELFPSCCNQETINIYENILKNGNENSLKLVETKIEKIFKNGDKAERIKLSFQN